MITHDLRVVNFFCDRVGVLYRGRMVELGTRRAVIENSCHPYTRMLMSAAPTGNPTQRPERIWVRGDAGQVPQDREACVFASRCWLRAALGNPQRCETERPNLQQVHDGQFAACHFAESVASNAAMSQAPASVTARP